jgi:hypothetical protein
MLNHIVDSHRMMINAGHLSEGRDVQQIVGIAERPADNYDLVRSFAAAEQRGREHAAVIADEYRIKWDQRGDFKQSDACRGLAAAIRNAKEA